MSDKKLPKIKVLKPGPKFKEKPWGKRTGYKKGTAFGKKSGGQLKEDSMAGMTRVGLSPAEMARAGTMSEEDRLRYMKKGGKVGKKKQGYKARKDESIAMRIKKKRSKKQLKASRDESYGKWGKGKGKGKINRSGGDAFVAASYGKG